MIQHNNSIIKIEINLTEIFNFYLFIEVKHL